MLIEHKPRYDRSTISLRPSRLTFPKSHLRQVLSYPFVGVARQPQSTPDPFGTDKVPGISFAIFFLQGMFLQFEHAGQHLLKLTLFFMYHNNLLPVNKIVPNGEKRVRSEGVKCTTFVQWVEV